KEGEEILVSVEDDGAGIAEEDMPHLFERFYKGKDGRHGIGLAIAKAAAETGGGTITCRNQNGAVFEVRFPSGNQSA
ncbi:MAG: sensor histidine kinase, partial [Solobacterium sp.]|nr:sensor histidine kinase [Solobacterium sp.]